MVEVAARKSWDSLSGREREVAWLVRQGLKSEEIALELGMDPVALEECVQGVYRTLGVDDPLGLALFVVYHRLALRQPPRQQGASSKPDAAAS